MIVFDLSCADGHHFEGWFGSSEDFSGQQARGLIACPHCGSAQIAKAPMAPAVPKKGNQLPAARTEIATPVAGGEMPPALVEALGKLAQMQADALKQSTWVGDSFAEQSRAMHYGERASEVIHGKATPKEAKALLEEGIPVAPLPFPIAPPDELN